MGLADAVTALGVTIGMTTSEIDRWVDVDGGRRIEIAEAVYVLDHRADTPATP